MQTVYKSSDYPYFRRFEHMTESSPAATVANRLRLYAEWSRYWNTSRPVLLEKSPQHATITRFAGRLSNNMI
jgi:hypothetical protein